MELHYLLLLFGVCQPSRTGPRCSAPPEVSLKAGLATLVLIMREPSQVVARCLIFGFSFWLDECAMGFPDSSCLFFDLIPLVYLLS